MSLKYTSSQNKIISNNMKKINLALTIIALSIAFLNCTKKIKNTPVKPETAEVKKSLPSSVIQPQPSNETLYEVFSIRRTACFGKCPSYEAKVMSDGTAFFTGGNNVEKMGNHTAMADKNEINTLVEKARKINYFEFQNRYPSERKNEIADLPSTLTSINDGRTTKKITNNYDCPAELVDFEKEIDAFFDKLDWKVSETKN